MLRTTMGCLIVVFFRNLQIELELWKLIGLITVGCKLITPSSNCPSVVFFIFMSIRFVLCKFMDIPRVSQMVLTIYAMC